MVDVIEHNIASGSTIKRAYTEAEKTGIAEMQPTTEEKWARIRNRRNGLLHETDYAALPDSPEMSDDMKTYRQALRDLPASKSNPDDIIFPSKP